MNPEQEANIHYKRKKVFKNEKSMNRSSCLLNILKICYNRQDLTRAWRNDEGTESLRYEAKKEKWVNET